MSFAPTDFSATDPGHIAAEAARNELEYLAVFGRRRLAELCMTFADIIERAAYLIETLGENVDDNHTKEHRHQSRLKALAKCGLPDGELLCTNLAENFSRIAHEMHAVVDHWGHETGIAHVDSSKKSGNFLNRILKSNTPEKPQFLFPDMDAINEWQSICQEGAAFVSQVVAQLSGNHHFHDRVWNLVKLIDPLKNAAYDLWTNAVMNPAVDAALNLAKEQNTLTRAS